MSESSKTAAERTAYVKALAKKNPVKAVLLPPRMTREPDGRIIFRDQDALDAYVREATGEQVKKRLGEAFDLVVDSARDWWENRRTR